MANLDVVLARICNMSQEGLGKGIKEQPHSALRRGPPPTPPTSLSLSTHPQIDRSGASARSPHEIPPRCTEWGPKSVQIGRNLEVDPMLETFRSSFCRSVDFWSKQNISKRFSKVIVEKDVWKSSNVPATDRDGGSSVTPKDRECRPSELLESESWLLEYTAESTLM